MIGYPTNRLLLVLDRPAAAPAALRDLAEVGVRPEDVSVLVGNEGVDQLHRLGGARGFLGRLILILRRVHGVGIGVRRHIARDRCAAADVRIDRSGLARYCARPVGGRRGRHDGRSEGAQ